MITSWMLYWMFMLNGIVVTSTTLAITGLIMCVLLNICYPGDDSVYLKKIVVGIIISLSVAIFTPTTKQAAIIWGVPKMLAAVQSVEIKNMNNIPPKIVDYVNAYLDIETEKLIKQKK